MDTHAWIWILLNDPKLSYPARMAAVEAKTIRLSPISFLEVSQKIRIGKWTEMENFLDQLPDLTIKQGILIADIVPKVALLAGNMTWDHRDPFDRIIAATTLLSSAVLLSRDTEFDTIDGLNRIW